MSEEELRELYYERITSLSKAISEGNEKDDIWLVDAMLRSMAEYINITATQEMQITMCRMRANDATEVREFIQSLDTRRKRVHDACIDELHILNRVAEEYGCETIYDFNISDDRIVIADTVIKPIVVEFFDNRKK